MKRIVFVLLLLAMDVDLVQSQRPKAARARQPAATLRQQPVPMRVAIPPLIASITFLRLADGAPLQAHGIGQGILSLGTVSSMPHPSQAGAKIQRQDGSFVVSTRLGLRIDLSAPSRAGSATVSAYLLSLDPLRSVWLDGVRLTIVPGVVSGHLAYGSVTEHILKIVVSNSAPPGELVDLIGVLVTPN